MYKCASVKRLQQINGVTPDTAKLIRMVWLTNDTGFINSLLQSMYIARRGGHVDIVLWEHKQLIIDKLLRSYGIELLGTVTRTCANVFYCNMGDAYTTTVLFVNCDLIVGCRAELTEKQIEQIREIAEKTKGPRKALVMYKSNDEGLALFRLCAANAITEIIVSKVTKRRAKKFSDKFFNTWKTDPGLIGDYVRELLSILDEI